MTREKSDAPKTDWADEILKWAQTKEGEEKLAAAIEKSNLAINEMKKSLVIDSEMLYSTFNR
jgi:hypothetical protein